MDGEHEGRARDRDRGAGAGIQTTSRPPPSRRSRRGRPGAPPRRRPAAAGRGRTASIAGGARRAGPGTSRRQESLAGIWSPARRRASAGVARDARLACTPARLRPSSGDPSQRGSVPRRRIESAPYMRGGTVTQRRARRAGPRLPARPAGRRARLPRLCDLWPDADIFTAVYDERGHRGPLRPPPRRPRRSCSALRPDARTFRALLPLYPYAMEALDLRGYDLVISSLERLGARRASPTADAVHVCYCHNPFRYAWNAREATLARARPARAARRSAVVFQRWRQWDWIAAQRVDRYVANSETTRSADRALLRARGRRRSTRRSRPTRFAPGDGRRATTSCSPS